MHDLPDFLSGEEQQNTIHVQIQFRKASPTRERRFFKKPLKSKPSPPPSPQQQGKSPQEGGPPPLGRRSPTTPRSKSPLLQHRSAASASASGAVVGADGTSPLNTSPPGKIFATRSNLEIAHLSPLGSKYDHESPLTPVPLPSSLQEFPLLPIPTKQNRGAAESGEGSKFKKSPMPKLEPLTSVGRAQNLAIHSHINHLSYKEKSISQPNLYRAPAADQGAESQKTGSSENISFEFMPRPPATMEGRGSTGNLLRLRATSPRGGGGGAVRDGLQVSSSLGNLSRRQPHTPGPGEIPPHLPYSSSTGDLCRDGRQLPQGGSSTSLRQLEEQGPSELVDVVELYILKQVTDFYHLIMAAWTDTEVVSQQNVMSRACRHLQRRVHAALEALSAN